MSLWEALLLGIIQGLTEFLPVSSSGHLELGKALFGAESQAAESLLFTLVMHAATGLSTVVVFRKQIAEIFRGLFEFKVNESSKYSLKIIISMLPAGFVGVIFKDEIEALFSGQLLLVGAMLIITGLLLFLADKAKRTEKEVSNLNAFIIGIAQAIAILPGISRSGATISTSVLLGIDRGKAAQFSFLMVVPLILGAFILDLKDVITGEEPLNASVSLQALSIGFLGAFFSGLLACRWMIALVRNSKLVYFSIYCFVIGAITTYAALYL
mgnify:CR=1 FL=1